MIGVNFQSGTVSSCTFRGTDVPPIAAQAVFCPEDNGFDRREAAVERAGDLGVTHPLVVAEHKWNLIVIRQAIQLFPHLAFGFLVQNLGERRRSGNVGDDAKIVSIDDREFLEFLPAQFVNAVPTCHLTHPRAKGIFLILFLEDNVKFQEDFRRGILSVFGLAKEPTANVQDEGIVRGMN